MPDQVTVPFSPGTANAPVVLPAVTSPAPATPPQSSFQVGALDDIMHPQAPPPAGTLTPEQMQAAPPVAPPPAGTLTPEQMKSAPLASQTPPAGDALKDMTPDELVTAAKANPEFDPVALYQNADAATKSNQAIWDKTKLAYNKLQQEGLFSGVTAGGIVKAAKETGKGFAGWAVNTVKALKDSPVAVKALFHADLTPEERDTFYNRLREQTEGAVGTATGLLGLGEMAVKAAKKAAQWTGITSSPKDYTSSDMDHALVTELANRGTMARAAKGDIPGLRDTVAALQEEGKPIRPEKVSELAAGSPFVWKGMGLGFEAAGAAAKAGLGLAGKAIPESVAALVPPIDAGAAARAALGRTLQGAGIAAEKTGAGVEKVTESSLVKNFGGVAGAVLGHHHGGILGAGAGLVAEKALEKLPRLAEKYGGKVADLGAQIAGPAEDVSSRTALALRDLAESTPSAVASVGTGAAFDAGLLATTTDTPSERAGFIPFGTAFGAAGALKGTAHRMVSGQIIAPRNYGTDTFVPNTANFKDTLGALHNSAYNAANKGIQTRINAVRGFGKGIGSDTEAFYVPRPEEGQQDPLPAALEKSGISPEQAQLFSQQNGVRIVNLKDNNGVNRRVIVFRDIDSAPHEAMHAMDDVIGANGVQALNDAAKRQYSPEVWNGYLDSYAKRLANGGEITTDPGSYVISKTGRGDAAAADKLWAQGKSEAEIKAAQDDAAAQGKQLWETVLTPEEKQQAVDNYVGNEIRAENGDAWVKSGPKNTLAAKMFNGVGHMMSLFGVEPLAGRTSEVGKVQLQFKTVQGQAKAAKGLISSAKPELPASAAPVVTPRALPARAIPATEEQRQQAAQEARDMSNRATTAPAKDALSAASDAIANNQGVRVDTNSQTGKEFFPYRVVETQDGGHTILGWDPGIFEQNAHDFFRHVSDHPELQGLVPFKTDKGLRSLTPPEWDRFNQSVKDFIHNQMAGFTGAGQELVVPQATQARSGVFPPEKTGAKPTPIPQDVADLINHLMSSKGQLSAIPRTDVVRGTKLPRNIQAQEISEATEPGRVTPTGRQFAGPKAVEIGVAGKPISEVNPLRDAMRKASPGLPEPKNVLQQLNLANIKKVTPAPELPQFRPNVLTTTAGFQPMAERPVVEVEGKDGKKYRVSHDGYQDFSSIGMGTFPQFTALEDMSGAGGPVKGSTTYGPSLEKAGFKVPEVRPPTAAEGAFQPNKDLQDVAKKYAGPDFVPHSGLAPINEARGKQIADTYAALPHDPNNPEVKKSYDAFKQETVAQWHALEAAGYKMEPWRGEGQPYKNSAEMAADIAENKHLWFFPTEAGYGEKGAPEAHPLLEPSGIKVGGTELPYNDVFRAVHDAFGHAPQGYEFGPRGELNAYLSHSKMYSPDARPAMAAETLGQNSWVNFGPHLRNAAGETIKKGEPGYIAPPERPFAEQKANVLPEAQMQPKTFIVRHGATEMNNADPAKDRIRGSIDVPLSPQGRKEARQTALDIQAAGGVDHIISSDLGRAHETAKEISKATGATIETTPGLRPWHFGPTIEGKPTKDMLPKIAELTENPDQRPPGGETFNEFKSRFLDAFKQAQDENQDRNSAIVTHYRGKKLLDAWRATGVDNDTIDRAVFEKYDKDKEPGHVDVVDKNGAEFQPAKAKEDKERLIHFSTVEGLKTLEPEYHGTGAPGAELARKRDYPELYVPRTYLGTKGYEKEAGLGDVRYRAEVKRGKLYDIDEDPDGLYPSSSELEQAGYAPMDQRAALSLYEKRIQDAGHEGYISRANNAVAKFTETPVRQLKPSEANFQAPKAEDFKDEKTLGAALKQPGWALFTATKEHLGAGTDEVNQTANENLEKALIADGYNPIEVKGNYKGVDQGKNFLVPGMTQEQAQEWGNKYGQESVLTNKGLIYNDGTVSPVNHDNTVIGKEAKNLDFYSQIPGGPAFSMGVDFARRVPLKRAEKQTNLFGGEEKTPLTTKQVSEMGTKELKEKYPEAVIANKVRNRSGELVDPQIPSDIVNAPLIKGMDRPEAVKTYASKLVEEAKKWIDHPYFKEGLKWYSEFTPQLKRVYGKDSQIMAELLAATSPNNAPDTNFAFANDALQGYKSGRFSKQISKFEEGLEKVKDGSWEKWVAKADPQGVQSEANFLSKWIEKYDLRPKQSNGKLYGMHSDAVLQVFARKWLEQTQGPKTQNFVKNLVGTGHEATVDVWADRTMRRLGYQDSDPRWRILPKNSTGVSDADFALSQEVFREAAKQLGVQPDALQGGMWFAEKQHWADNAWGRLDLGDYRKEIAKVPMLESGIQQRLAAQKAQAKVKPMEQQAMFQPEKYEFVNWGDFGAKLAGKSRVPAYRLNKPALLELEKLKAEGYKSLDYVGNASYHDYETRPVFHKDDSGKFPLTESGFKAALSEAKKAEAETWEAAYGDEPPTLLVTPRPSQ